MSDLLNAFLQVIHHSDLNVLCIVGMGFRVQCNIINRMFAAPAPSTAWYALRCFSSTEGGGRSSHYLQRFPQDNTTSGVSHRNIATLMDSCSCETEPTEPKVPNCRDTKRTDRMQPCQAGAGEKNDPAVGFTPKLFANYISDSF